LPLLAQFFEWRFYLDLEIENFITGVDLGYFLLILNEVIELILRISIFFLQLN
jgi:hypothetical protein